MNRFEGNSKLAMESGRDGYFGQELHPGHLRPGFGIHDQKGSVPLTSLREQHQELLDHKINKSH